MPNIGIVLYDKCYLSSVTGPMDLFDIANAHLNYHASPDDKRFKLSTVSQESDAKHTSGRIRFATDYRFSDAPQFDVVIVPSFPYRGFDALTQKMQDQKSMLDWLKVQWQNGATLASSCTGTFLLAQTGLLNNKRATTTWWLEAQFRQMFPTVRLAPREVVTSQDRLVCAGAMASSLQMAMLILEKFGSDSLASQCAKTMMIDSGRHVQPFSQDKLSNQETQDPVVSRAQYWLQNHLKSVAPMSQLALIMGVSQRTLTRKFKAHLGATPLAYLQSLRIDAAKNLLESSRVSIQDVLTEVGYQDYSAFSQLFKKQVGITPAAYRQLVSGR